MAAKKGDTIIIEAKRAAQSGRTGVIEKVLQKEPARYEVRWSDGKTTIFTPAAGVARIEPKKAQRKTAKRAAS